MENKSARIILGEDFYKGLEAFYRRMWQSDHEYKVCLIRRSYVLGRLFLDYQTTKVEKESIKFITDAALLSLSAKISDTYISRKEFPSILICDDILIHGRALNAFLVKFENQIIDCLHSKGYEVDENEIRTQLTYAIDLWVYVKDSEQSMLLDRYWLKLRADRIEGRNVWRDLSNRISILISDSGVANANFVLSSQLNMNDVTALREIGGYRRIVTRYRSSTEMAFIKKVSINEGVRAIFTVRFLMRSGASEICGIPLIFLPECSPKVKETVLNRICEKLPQDMVSSIKEKWTERNASEFITTVLSQNLWFLFLEEQSLGINNIQSDKTAKEKVAYNFGDSEEVYKLIEKVWANPLFSKREFEELINYIVENTDPLFDEEIDNEQLLKSQKRKLLTALEETIYQEGLEAEKIAYELRSRSHMPTSIQYKELRTEISQIVRKVYEKEPDCFSSYYLFALFLQFMDVGNMVFSVYKSHENNICTYAQYFKAGEQSLALEAWNHYEYIPLIVAMDRKCRTACLDFKNELEEYAKQYTISEKKVKELLRYKRDLDESGQKIEDWNFNMLNRAGNDVVEIDFEDAYRGKDIYKRLREELTIALRQRELVDNYMR